MRKRSNESWFLNVYNINNNNTRGHIFTTGMHLMLCAGFVQQIAPYKHGNHKCIYRLILLKYAYLRRQCSWSTMANKNYSNVQNTYLYINLICLETEESKVSISSLLCTVFSALAPLFIINPKKLFAPKVQVNPEFIDSLQTLKRLWDVNYCIIQGSPIPVHKAQCPCRF